MYSIIGVNGQVSAVKCLVVECIKQQAVSPVETFQGLMWLAISSGSILMPVRQQVS